MGLFQIEHNENLLFFEVIKNVRLSTFLKSHKETIFYVNK